MNYLSLWQNENGKLKDLLNTSEQLKAVQPHAENLGLVAATGIEAMNKIKEGATPDAGWIADKVNVLKQANQAYGETELCIMPEIKSLVKQQMQALQVTYPAF